MVELVEFRYLSHFAGITMTIVKGGVNSEKCEIVYRVVEFRDHCHFAGISMIIVKGGLNSEKCEMLCGVVEFRDLCHLAGIAMTIVKGGVNSEKCEMLYRVVGGSLGGRTEGVTLRGFAASRKEQSRAVPLYVDTRFGGIGKRALAREAADWLTQTGMYAAAYFHSFEHGSDTVAQLAGLGNFLGVYDSDYNPQQPDTVLAKFDAVLAERPLLIIADNLQYVLPNRNAPLAAEERQPV